MNQQPMRPTLLVDVPSQSQHLCQWAKKFCKEKMCFSNAVNMSDIDSCDVVVGYLFSSKTNEWIEHAWNAKGETHFDLTIDLFVDDFRRGLDQHHQLIRLHPEQVRALMTNFGGVHHQVLMQAGLIDSY
ncbi:hypothetical protein [Vibrio alginolyticus]|uniref:hypothetical protein n=1 Tax=Vibrio alginolyticus TaxID=663 RepID=UPI000AD4A523|nr:hypothetical protein [Vibrio alginolyticus]